MSAIGNLEGGNYHQNQKTFDQGWQQLQTHIEGFVGQALSDSVQRIEYKPRFMVPLLKMSPARQQNELLGAMAIGGNFSQKGGGT